MAYKRACVNAIEYLKKFGYSGEQASAGELGRQLDLSTFGLGAQSLNWALYNLVIGHAVSHAGEIAAVKGVQGLKGHPF